MAAERGGRHGEAAGARRGGSGSMVSRSLTKILMVKGETDVSLL